VAAISGSPSGRISTSVSGVGTAEGHVAPAGHFRFCRAIPMVRLRAPALP
jgi:hypothetical protein